VGLFKKIKEFVLGEDIEDSGWNLDGDEKENEEDMSGYYSDYDAEPTVLYSDNPQMPQEIKGGGNPDRLNDATMREVARINAANPIPGQVMTGQRGRRQAPQGPRRIGGQQMRQQQMAAQRQLAQQQQWEQQQQWNQPQQPQQPVYDPQQQQAFYQQQQMYYQQQQQGQQGQQQQAKQPNPAIQRAPVNYGEPYSEMIVSNGQYHFFMDLPGVPEEDIGVSYVNMNLVITGTRKLKSEMMAPKVKGKGNKGKRPECDALVTVPPFVENFRYSFYFPRPVDQESFKTELSQGILHIWMDILGEKGPGGIAIKVGG
jgi:HSP20 family molecular chaperone IbpA